LYDPGLCALAPRAPAGSVKEFLMYYGHNSLWGILVLVADIWAIVNIFQSNASTERKVLWTVLVILLPVLGFIIWLFAGPRTGKS
jgi:succinate dehydrogenase/fumarate reductase cytochrome b subunit